MMPLKNTFIDLSKIYFCQNVQIEGKYQDYPVVQFKTTDSFTFFLKLQITDLIPVRINCVKPCPNQKCKSKRWFASQKYLK